MRILMAQVPWYGKNCFSSHVRDALAMMGHELTTFTLGMEQEADLFLKIKKNNPQVIIVFLGHFLTQQTIDRIRKEFNPLLVLWENDDPWRFEQLSLKWAKLFDLCITNDTYSLDMYRLHGVNNILHIPFGCNPEHHYKMPEGTKASDVSFVGSCYPNRVHLLSGLTKYQLSIWGDQAWRKTPLASHYRGPVFDPARLREIYSSSKININIHYMAFKDPVVTGSFTNQRPYEILGCGGFCITDWRQHTSEEFVHGKHLVLFKETHVISKLVDYYLQHEAERVSIATQGHALVHGEYTYEKRLLPLLDLLRK